MPLGNPEQHLPRRIITDKEHAETIARVLERDLGVEVKTIAQEGEPTTHIHIDLPSHNLSEVPAVVPKGHVQIELQPGHLEHADKQSGDSKQDLAA